jgi:16S rRNA (cytosine967-C5)-methyltransferase
MSNYQLRSIIADVLFRVEKNKSFSHILIDHEIRANHFLAKDAALFTEIVYGTVQRQMTIDYYLEKFIKKNKKLDLFIKVLLRMSIYQMVFLDKVPDHAIIHEAVEVAKKRQSKGAASFVNGVLRNIQRKGIPNLSEINDDIKRLSIQTSHPQWLVKRWINAYGYETAKEMCKANLERPHVSVRVQPLKISREEALQKLKEEGVEGSPSLFSDQGIIVDQGNVLNTTLFKSGLLTVQDESSMLAGEMLKAAPGMDVLDACSAPGGKATHIAEKMKNVGKLYAHDLHKNKIKRINRKASELDLTIIDAKQADARNLQDLYEAESFDRILIDAPCSGLGVIQGKPEIKYEKTEQDVHRLAAIQLEILEAAAPLLKKEGLLLYTTCTVEKAENEEVITSFLEKNNDFEIDERFFADLPAEIGKSEGVSQVGLQLFPQTFQTDGFFLARLKKRST